MGSFIQTRSGSTLIFHRGLLISWFDRIENREEAKDKEWDTLEGKVQSAVSSQQISGKELAKISSGHSEFLERRYRRCILKKY